MKTCSGWPCQQSMVNNTGQLTLWRTGSVLNRSFRTTVVPTARGADTVLVIRPSWSYSMRVPASCKQSTDISARAEISHGRKRARRVCRCRGAAAAEAAASRLLVRARHDAELTKRAQRAERLPTEAKARQAFQVRELRQLQRSSRERHGGA